MDNFRIHKQLEKDCINLGKLNGIHLLLMNVTAIPWFIFVPETDKTEIYELEQPQKLNLYNAMDELSLFIKEAYQIDKLNIASIGNIVSQLHVHVIGRRRDDPCWPGVVWGANFEKEAYEKQEIAAVKADLKEYFSNQYMTFS